MQTSVKLKYFLFYLLSGNFIEMTRYCLEKLRLSTLQNMPKRKRDISRIYRSGNEKKIKAAKASDIKRISGTIKKFTVEKNSTEIEKSVSHSVP